MDYAADREKDEGCEGTISGRTPVFSDAAASQASPSEPHPQRHPKDQRKKSGFNRNRTKSRVKSSSRRLFLDNSLSEEEEADDTEKAVGRDELDPLSERTWCGHHQSEGTENRGSGCLVAEQDASLIPLSTTFEDSWMCPLTSDKLSPSPSDTETEKYSLQPVRGKSPDQFRNCSGVILKLRRMFSTGLNRKKDRYQAISDSGTFADPSLLQIDDGEGDVSMKRDLHRRSPKVTHKWHRTGSFSHTLRPLSKSSKRKHRSLLKIKYCPYLSACHSAEHRRRWVLRSAVQRAQRAMRFYPDLVGKRIRHLYEEDDKSEVWYRGEVLRIHEAHTNPLKTIFEVRYDSEPEWKYYLELLMDYKNGWLKVED